MNTTNISGLCVNHNMRHHPYLAVYGYSKYRICTNVMEKLNIPEANYTDVYIKNFCYLTMTEKIQT